MMEIDFLNIEYLKYGNEKQRKAYQTLIKHQVMKILDNFKPILVGTIPIEIDIDSSDLDIICHMKEEELFKKIIQDNFS